MRKMAVLGALFLIGTGPQAEVEDLSWLSGAWVSESKEGWTEELWTPPRAGVMLGTNRSGKGGQLGGFEFMRIAADESGAISFWGSPGGKPPVAFRLTSAKPGEAVFENPAHDYPTRIVYRRDGQGLIATVSGPGGKDPLSWTFRRP